MKTQYLNFLGFILLISLTGVGCDQGNSQVVSKNLNGQVQTVGGSTDAGVGGKNPVQEEVQPSPLPPHDAPSSEVPTPVVSLPPSSSPPDVTPEGPLGIHQKPLPIDPSQLPIGCPAKVGEDFPLDQVRFYFYTSKRENGGTNQAISFSPIGKTGDRGNIQLIPYEVSKAPGKTDPGSLDEVTFRVAKDTTFTSAEFSKIKISLGSSTADDPWFLGALYVEGLPKNCDPNATQQWTPLYFNPFLRTWISTDRPLIVSDDDAVAIFIPHIANKDDAGTDDEIRVATPFETKGTPLYDVSETPVLDYEGTNDFAKGKSYYYGRTYFAENQAWAVKRDSRLIGRWSDLHPEDVNKGFKILIKGGSDGVHFDSFSALLIRPIFGTGANPPFQAYLGLRWDFWLGAPGDCSGFLGSDCVIPDDIKEDVVSTSYSIPKPISNLGEELSDQSPLGYLKWAIQHDDPDKI